MTNKTELEFLKNVIGIQTRDMRCLGFIVFQAVLLYLPESFFNLFTTGYISMKDKQRERRFWMWVFLTFFFGASMFYCGYIVGKAQIYKQVPEHRLKKT